MQAERVIGYLRLAAGLSFVLALVNHLLPPKPFALTQLLFDYSHGLTRRGLVGELTGHLFGSGVSQTEIYWLAAGVTMVGALAFYLFLMRMLDPDSVPAWLLIILAINSFGFTSFVGNTGYLDGVLLSLTLAALALPMTNAAHLLRGVLVIAGVMVHENMLPYFTLLLAFDLWLRGGTRHWVLAAMPVLLGALTFGGLAWFGAFDPATAESFAKSLEHRADFWLDPTALDVSGRGISGNLTLMAELRGTTKYWAWVLFDGVPLLAMSLYLTWLATRLLTRRSDQVLAVLAIFGPLSLNLIAFDVVRFGVASVLVGFLSVALAIRNSKEAGARFETVFQWPQMLVLLVLNVNIFTIQVNVGAHHVGQFPWVLLTQLKWLGP